MKPLAAIIALALAACNTATIQPPVKVNPGPVLIPIAPRIDATAQTIQTGTVVAAKLQVQIDGLQRSATTLQEGMARATEEADRLRKAKSATETELTSLYQVMNSANEKVSVLIRENSDARETMAAMVDALDQAKKSVDGAVKAANEKDTQVAKLLDEAKALKESRVFDHAKIAALEKTTAKLTGDAAMGAFLRHLGWSIVGIATVIAVIKIFAAGSLPLKMIGS